MNLVDFKNNDNGASLLEVMIAMVVLAIGFLGVIALALVLTNNNAAAGKINTATAIAQAEVSQLNCLRTSGILQNFPQISPWTYTYTVNPTVSTPDKRNTVTSCITEALSKGSSHAAPDSSLGVTIPYTVTINFFNNPNPFSSTLINAQIEVGWRDIGRHIIVMNDIIS